MLMFEYMSNTSVSHIYFGENEESRYIDTHLCKFAFDECQKSSFNFNHY